MQGQHSCKQKHKFSNIQLMKVMQVFAARYAKNLIDRHYLLWLFWYVSAAT